MPAGVYARHNGEDVKKIDELERKIALLEVQLNDEKEKSLEYLAEQAKLSAYVDVLKEIITEAMGS